jgi:class 3 adenylate cyclase/tetratricopeptide (TPR) repeat protein
MKFSELVEQVRTLLQRQGRVSYRALKREFGLDDEYIEDLKAELIDARQLATDENGKVLVWIEKGINGEKDKRGKGEDGLASSVQSLESEERRRIVIGQTLDPGRQTLDAAERRQLTVMFCDLVDSTALSEQLDPEDWRAVVRQYQQVCAAVIQRYDGYIAQYLGDGVLVYFGYPAAHEDDAQRAARAGLEIVAALQKQVLSPFAEERRSEGAKIGAIHTPHPSLLPQGEKGLQRLQVRIGIHTGLVVVGEIGGSEKREMLALGETPNIAARLQSLAAPDTVVISAATYRLIEGLLDCRDLGPQSLKGVSTSAQIYQIVGEGVARSRLDVAMTRGLTPLVGRDEEVELLRRRWEQTKTREGQVVLLNGEAGIGKSRLLQALGEQLSSELHTRLECRCSPFHQNSAFYPVIDLLQRVLQFRREDTVEEKLAKLEAALIEVHGRAPVPETVSLFASLLSLPLPDHYPRLTLTPQKQKEKTQQAVLALLLQETTRRPVRFDVEDVHWADPSTLEFLSLLIERAVAARLLVLVTFRPDFTPPWALVAHVTQLSLRRLGRKQVKAMVERLTGGKTFSDEIIQQLITRTDGVPLFVEELTKSAVESVGATGRTLLPAIPMTLHDSLMARLDRMSTAKEVAQLGAAIGREFSYDLLHAVSSLDDGNLQQALTKLVDAELLYQRGTPPQSRYLFKHALIQDAAYQSLLKSTRQQYHKQIARALEKQFPETKDTQPELVAQHYTEAGMAEQAIPYWQSAGHRAVERSANTEAISHLSKGLELLSTLPETPQRSAQEVSMLLLRAVPLIATQGYTSPAVRKSYERAHELCEQVTDTSQLFRALWGLALFYTNAGENRVSYQVIARCMELAEREQDPSLLLQAHFFTGALLHWFGELPKAASHLQRATELYEFERDRSSAFVCGIDLGMGSLAYDALNLWYLGYPDRALKQTYEALVLAEKVAHPLSQCFALNYIVLVYLLRGEAQLADQQNMELASLADEQMFQHYHRLAMLFRGVILVEQGNIQEGEHLALAATTALRNAGTAGGRTLIFGFLSEVSGRAGHTEEGLHFLNRGLSLASEGEDMQSEAELYRLKGTLTLQSKVQSPKSKKKLKCVF